MSDTINAAMAIAAMVAAAVGADTGAAARPPITMAMSAHGSGIRLTVTGAAPSPIEAAYALDVSSDTGGGNNHSVQRGRVRLVPGKTVTLITLDLGGVRAGNWTATLQVDPVGAGSYRQALSSDATEPKGRCRLSG